MELTVGGGERDICTYISLERDGTRSTETMKIFLRSDIVKHASLPLAAYFE